jgi:ABC-type sugar transport system ATPase subunit
MLAIADLTKTYGETRALDRVSIAFSPGTIHTILGENGSGKSTLVKLLSGIVRPDSGTIRIDGTAFSASDPAGFQAAGIATVFQEVLVAPDRDVVDNVLMGIDGWIRRSVPRRERRATVERALRELSETPVRLDMPVGRLSLATRQLVVLARALVRKPRVLILDEITAALDFSDCEAVFRGMQRLAGEGALLLFITHRMDEVMRLSNRISVLRSGRLVATLDRDATSPDELLRLMAPDTARELLHA